MTSSTRRNTVIIIALAVVVAGVWLLTRYIGQLQRAAYESGQRAAAVMKQFEEQGREKDRFVLTSNYWRSEAEAWHRETMHLDSLINLPPDDTLAYPRVPAGISDLLRRNRILAGTAEPL